MLVLASWFMLSPLFPPKTFGYDKNKDYNAFEFKDNYGKLYEIIFIGRKGVMYVNSNDLFKKQGKEGKFYDRKDLRKLPWFVVKYKFPNLYEELGPRRVFKNALKVREKGNSELDYLVKKAVQELEETITS